MIQTVSLETAQLLKEAGFPQDAYFYWAKDKSGIYTDEELQQSPGDCPECAAPMTDELLEELPDLIKQDGIATVLVIGKPNNIFKVGYRPPCRQIFDFENKSLPEALANLWLHLKQQGLLEEKENQ